MLKTSKAFSGFSVDDIDKAKKFYSETLGLEVTEKAMGEGYITLMIHTAGGNGIFVYSKPNHEPATYTILNFPVTNIDETVTALKEHGVSFEQYDLGFTKTDEQGIARGDENNPDIAWFKDPAGNILSVLQLK